MQDSLYDREGANLIVKNYIHFLRVLSENVLCRVNDIPLFEQSLVKRGIDVGTGNVIDFKWHSTKTVVHQVNQWVRTQSDVVSVKDLTGGVLTYQQVLVRIEQTAHAITNAGAKAGSSVAVSASPRLIRYAVSLLYCGWELHTRRLMSVIPRKGLGRRLKNANRE